jgi:FlaA1/EpsC-like NDP-sugar epimerase
MEFLLAAGLAGTLAAGVLALVDGPSPSMPVLFAILLFNLLLGTRMSFRMLRRLLARFAAPARKVLVVGAGSIAESAARYLLGDSTRQFDLVGFVDNDCFKHHMLVRGIPVLGRISDIERLYDDIGFEEILIAENDWAEEDLAALEFFGRNHNVVLSRYTTQIDSLPIVAQPQKILGALPSRIAPNPTFPVAIPGGESPKIQPVVNHPQPSRQGSLTAIPSEIVRT